PDIRPLHRVQEGRQAILHLRHNTVPQGDRMGAWHASRRGYSEAARVPDGTSFVSCQAGGGLNAQPPGKAARWLIIQCESSCSATPFFRTGITAAPTSCAASP